MKPTKLIDGVAYYRFGRGADLFFVHGWPLSAATWRHVVPLLANHFTCHLIDLPGTGKTTVTTGISLEGHAHTVRKVVDALGLERYALVAHDSGGFVARLVAAEDPRVTGLVLGNTEIPGHMPFLITIFAALHRLGIARALFSRILASPRLLRSRLAFAGCFTDAAYVNGEFFETMLSPLRTPAALHGQLHLLASFNRQTFANLSALHRRIRIPTALVWGTDDPFFPLDKMKPIISQFAGPTRLYTIEGGKLFAHEDHASAFADATISHLFDGRRLVGANTSRSSADAPRSALA